MRKHIGCPENLDSVQPGSSGLHGITEHRDNRTVRREVFKNTEICQLLNLPQLSSDPIYALYYNSDTDLQMCLKGH